MSGNSGSLSLLPKRLQHSARRSTVLKVPDPPKMRAVLERPELSGPPHSSGDL